MVGSAENGSLNFFVSGRMDFPTVTDELFAVPDRAFAEHRRWQIFGGLNDRHNKCRHCVISRKRLNSDRLQLRGRDWKSRFLRLFIWLAIRNFRNGSEEWCGSFRSGSEEWCAILGSNQ